MFGRKRKKSEFRGKTIYTIDEYLEIEEQVSEANEFWNMNVIPLNRPDDFTARVCYSMEKFSKELADKNYKLFTNLWSNRKKVWIESENCLFYPDLFVVENEIGYYSGRDDIISNPLMVIEISEIDAMAMSRNGECGDQTYLRDRTIKFWKYQKIPSLKEYAIVADAGGTVVVETYNRLGDDSWKYRVFSKTGNKVVEFETIRIKLTGSVFYFGNDQN